MEKLRRWVPGPRRAASEADPSPAVRHEELSPRDLKFCSELALHGGLAVSEKGFAAEGDLVRMRQAGLLDLERDAVPPFVVTRVALSNKARDLLGSRREAPRPISATPPAKDAPVRGPLSEQDFRRNGFEVARGMISVALKAEIASWNMASQPGGASGLEGRILARIGRIVAPF